MIKSIFSILFLCSALTANTQTNDIFWGPEYPISNKVANPIPVGEAEGKYFVIRNHYKKNYLESYSMETFVKESSVLLDTRFEGEDLAMVNVMIFNNKPTFLFATLDSVGTKFHYFLQSYQPKTLQPDKLTEVGTRDYSGQRPYSMLNQELLVAYYYANDLIFYVDTERSEMILGINKITYGVATSEVDIPKSEYNLMRINANFEITETIPFAYPFRFFSAYQYKLTSSDELIISGSEDRLEYENKKQKRIPEKRHILKYNLKSGDLVSSEIILEGYDLRSYIFNLNSDGTILLTGLTKSKEGGLGGCFSQKYSADLKLISSTFEDFEKDFVSSTWTKKEEKKNEKKEDSEPALYDYYIQDFLVGSDGTLTLLSEQFYVQFHTYVVNGTTSTTTTYVYGDIIATKFDKEGKFLWKTAIKKNQLSSNDLGKYSSFFAYMVNDQINVIFNERESDMVEPFTNGTGDEKGNRVFTNRVTIDANGQLKKDKLFEFPEKKFKKLVPKSCAAIDGKYIFLYARTKSAAVMGKMKI